MEHGSLASTARRQTRRSQRPSSIGDAQIPRHASASNSSQLVHVLFSASLAAASSLLRIQLPRRRPLAPSLHPPRHFLPGTSPPTPPPSAPPPPPNHPPYLLS